MINTILNAVILLFSFSAGSAILIHDTNADKALKVVTSSGSSPNTTPGGDAHTHVHRASANQADRDMRNSHPRMIPKTNERRYVVAKTFRGSHPFDDYLLPVAS